MWKTSTPPIFKHISEAISLKDKYKMLYKIFFHMAQHKINVKLKQFA